LIAGRYEPLGNGLARDTELDRVVRIRWIASTAEVDDPRLSDPSVVRVFDVGEHDGRRFAAIEHVDGLPLALRAPLPVDDAVILGTHAARALVNAHALGLVHAGEVLVRDDGVPKLSGFRRGEPGEDVRSLAQALNDTSPGLPPLYAETPEELVRELRAVRPAAAETVAFAPITPTRRGVPLSLVFVGLAVLALTVGLIAAFDHGSKPKPRPIARVVPVRPGGTAEQEARNLSAWLSRYSR
jgi:eukaryotic-like serine/threonine-protein kinase